MKKFNIYSVCKIGGIILVLLLAMISAACKPNPCPKQKVETSSQILVLYLSLYSDTIDLFLQSDDVSVQDTIDGIDMLSGQVERYKVPECLETAKTYLLGTMSTMIDGLQNYQETGDIEYFQDKLAESINQVEMFSTEIELILACAPDCSLPATATVTP